MVDTRTLRSDEPLAVELTAALKQGEAGRLRRLFAANLGLARQRVEADPPPRPEELSGPFWNACHGGQLTAAQYLLAHGADPNWPAPWSGQTPLDIAEQAGHSDVVAWLLGRGAVRGSR